jgi:hypothetical protein
LVHVLAEPFGIIQHLPAQTQPAYAAFAVTPRTVQEWVDEFASIQVSSAQAAAVSSFGDLPLIVLTAALDQQEGWQAMQIELLLLSSNSQQMFADKSGHNMEIDQPEAATILAMVSQLQ